MKSWHSAQLASVDVTCVSCYNAGMAEEKPKRRWYQFSLQTFLVLVTLVCLWLGWEGYYVRSRRAMLERIRIAHGQYSYSRDWSPMLTLAICRGVLDSPVNWVHAPESMDGERQDVASLFPEASVAIVTFPKPAAKSAPP